MAIDVILKWLAEGAQKVVDDAAKINEEIDKTGEKAEEAGQKFDEVGEKVEDAGEKVEDTGKKVEGLTKETEKAKSQADKLGDAFKNVRKAGLAMTAVGAGMSVLAHRMTEARIEADKLQGMLNAKLSSAGMTHASDEVNELASALAMLNGEDPGRLADKIANVVSTGRGFRSLAKSGIVISSDERSEIRAADPEEQWKLIQAAAQRSMSELEGSLTDLQKATYAQQVRWDELQEQMGEGSSVVRVALYNNVLSPLYSILETNEGLAKTAGGITAIGGAALSTAGSLLTMGGQLGMTLQGLSTLGITGVGTFASISGAIVPAVTGLIGMVAPIAALVAPFLAVAAAAAAAFYAIDKLTHWNEDKALKANIKKGDEAEEKLLKLTNQKRRKQGKPALTMEQFREGTEPAGTTSQAQAPITNFTPPAMPAGFSVPPSAMPAATSAPSLSNAEMIKQAEAAEAQRLAALNPNRFNAVRQDAASSATVSSEGANKWNVTLKPKTRTQQNSKGDWVVHILPETFTIPNTLGKAVEAL